MSLLVALGACSRSPAPPPLGADEEALVDTYVRLTVLQALHENAADSTAAVLAALSATADTSAIRRALAGLSREPLRWEQVYGAIAARLEELESTPSLWWKVARGDTVSVPEPPRLPPTAPSARIRVPGR